MGGSKEERPRLDVNRDVEGLGMAGPSVVSVRKLRLAVRISLAVRHGHSSIKTTSETSCSKRDGVNVGFIGNIFTCIFTLSSPIIKSVSQGLSPPSR